MARNPADGRAERRRRPPAWRFCGGCSLIVHPGSTSCRSAGAPISDSCPMIAPASAPDPVGSGRAALSDRRVVPAGREPERAHARRVERDVPRAGRRAAPDADAPAPPHRRPARARAALPLPARLAAAGDGGAVLGARTRTSTSPTTCCRSARSGSSWTTGASRCSATACCRRRSTAAGRCGRSGWRRASPTTAAGSWPRSTTPWWTGARRSRSPSCCSTSSRRRLRSYRCRGRRRPAPGVTRLAARAVALGAEESLRAARGAARMAGEPRAAASRIAGTLRRAALAAGEDLLRPAPASALNARIGPRRTLVRHSVDLDAVRQVKRAAGADRQRRLPRARRRRAARADGAAAAQGDGARERARRRRGAPSLGNRISFAFVGLPLDVASGRARLARHPALDRRLQARRPPGGRARRCSGALGLLPDPLRGWPRGRWPARACST